MRLWFPTAMIVAVMWNVAALACNPLTLKLMGKDICEQIDQYREEEPARELERLKDLCLRNVAPEFCTDEVRASIRDDQRRRESFRTAERERAEICAMFSDRDPEQQRTRRYLFCDRQQQ